MGTIYPRGQKLWIGYKDTQGEWKYAPTPYRIGEELLDTNPCVLKRGELPKKIDKDPTWRQGAIFTKNEVEAAISDDRIPMDRRVLYALLLLAGLRFGEAAALRWRSYQSTIRP